MLRSSVVSTKIWQSLSSPQELVAEITVGETGTCGGRQSDVTRDTEGS
jgi:hypothetical protein